ncbi:MULTISPECIES: MBL fold metallo-hydrolase [unclassified Oceanobacter]|uniref:MBL fold metallo-hydrolase n=1 Tax=unclassified Oceanobacter TaxID=2620260 RepID=UPI0026E39E6C|nr:MULTISPECIES: MBL fold metallo-hydrolase [unclassified Oceanobacter]MDO6683514.1 MBL fold metallo-hydrolase [Oceanobacter sp. 5_MG-2023]MDP2547368.1 MBL fold metallo-hydrolase [Oceanobacter sp. 4_MG-2023]
MQIQSFYHQDTSTYTHWLEDTEQQLSLIVDPVMDFDQKSGRTGTGFIDAVLDRLAEKNSRLVYVLETHAHADHLSAADYLRRQTGARIVIGQPIKQVQGTFSKIFNEPATFVADGHQFDVLVADGDTLTLGDHQIRVLATPGHTPACVSYVVDEQVAFIGDTLFAPDTGTARCDFPGGDSDTLYHSIQRLFALGDGVRLYLCHDYPPDGRPAMSSATVAEQRQHNIHIRDGISQAAFVALRTARDAGLAMPRLILPSLQINIRAGALPDAEDNGVSYLKLPLNLF